MTRHIAPNLQHVRQPGLARLVAALATAATCSLSIGVAAAPNTPLPPLRELNPTEVNAVLGLPKLSTAELKLKVAATTRVTVWDRNLAATRTRTAVQRQMGSNAAVYSGWPVTTATVLPAGDPGSQLANFKTDGDLAQTWATMTAAGVPHLFAWAYGDFQAEATAGWHTTLTLPAGGGTREVFLRVAVPPLVVSGDTETGGEHRWRARVRAELLVNGFPAWTTEATRLRSEYKNGAGVTAENVTLVQFGRPLVFATDDEDSSTSNDSTSFTLRQLPSAARTVHLTLGRHAEGSRLNLAWVLRGTAWSEPKALGGNDHRCKWNYVMDRFFCSRASLGLTGSEADAPEVRYGP